jgi:L-amino acid N-acyltransferase YncA
MSARIRLATSADLPAINDIYNHYVAHSTCTFQTEPETPADRRAWFDHHGPAHPVTVAEDPLTGQVLGWSCLGEFKSRCAYRMTVENSVYIRHDLHGRGLGRMLLTDLIARAAALGHRSIIGIIAADQPASLALHEKLGFQKVAQLRQVGFKFDRWIDTVYVQRMLDQKD